MTGFVQLLPLVMSLEWVQSLKDHLYDSNSIKIWKFRIITWHENCRMPGFHCSRFKKSPFSIFFNWIPFYRLTETRTLKILRRPDINRIELVIIILQSAWFEPVLFISYKLLLILVAMVLNGITHTDNGVMKLSVFSMAEVSTVIKMIKEIPRK